MPTCRAAVHMAGIGGDAFALFWDAKAAKMRCMMGNGRSPAGLTIEAVRCTRPEEPAADAAG